MSDVVGMLSCCCCCWLDIIQLDCRPAISMPMGGEEVQNKASHSPCSDLELCLEVAVEHGVEDWVSHGRGHTNQVAEQVGKHHITWRD